MLLLVLCGTFLATPIFLLLLVHHVQCLHFAHPGIDHGIDLSLAAGKVTGNVCYQVQPFLLAVHIERDTRCQHTNGGTNGCHHRHCELRTYSINRILHTLRHLWQTVEVEAFIFLHDLFQTISASCVNALVHAITSHLEEHILQPLGHLRTLFRQGGVDALHLLCLREPVVAGNNGVHQFAVEAADVT